MTIERWLAAIAVACLATGCLGTGNTVPPVLREARERSDAGHAAFAEGRLDEATLAYGDALARYRSIDQPEGTVRSLVNLAVVRQAAGEKGDAADCLDAIDRYVATLSADELGGSLAGLRAEAGWMRAYLAADAMRPAEAWRELEKGRALDPPRHLRGRFDNLEARLRLDADDPAGARAVAARAARANRRSGEENEEADSWRLLGRAALATGEADLATRAFASALDIDRRLARPAKVADDLEGLARARRALGDESAAAALAERARLARRAAGSG